MKLAYVSGKYTDNRGPVFAELNICYAAEVAIKLWSLGIAVICPHTNTKHFDGATDYETFLDGDMLMIDKCDLMVMVDNWSTSSGAKLERDRAISKNIPVFEWSYSLDLILKFCWPDGVPEKYIRYSGNLLPVTRHDNVRNHSYRQVQAAGGIY
jgi:hypothetical protein